MGTNVILESPITDETIVEAINSGESSKPQMKKADSKIEIPIPAPELPMLHEKFGVPPYFREALLDSQKLFHSYGNVMSTHQISKLFPYFHQSIFSNTYFGLVFQQLQIDYNPLDELFGLEWEKVLIPDRKSVV